MKLLGSTKNKINKDENGENIPYLEITEVVLVHCNTVNNDCQQYSRVLYIFVRKDSFGQLFDISTKILFFSNFWFSIFMYWSIVYWSKI